MNFPKISHEPGARHSTILTNPGLNCLTLGICPVKNFEPKINIHTVHVCWKLQCKCNADLQIHHLPHTPPPPNSAQGLNLDISKFKTWNVVLETYRLCKMLSSQINLNIEHSTKIFGVFLSCACNSKVLGIISNLKYIHKTTCKFAIQFLFH